MGEGGEVAQFEVGVAVDVEVVADGGEQFGLFDGVDAEVGFEVEVDVEHVGGVAGLLGDECEHGLARRRRRPSPVPATGAERAAGCDAAGRHGPACGGRVAPAACAGHEGDDVGEGGEVAEFEVGVAFDVEVVADGGEQSRLA